MIELILYSLLTIVVFLFLKRLLVRFSHPIANPLLWSILLLIPVFLFTPLDAKAYQTANNWLIKLLEPAVVALAIPLFVQLQHVKKQLLPIVLCCLGGSILASGSGLLLARLISNDEILLMSLLPKSITSPIAMEISQQFGGLPPLAAGVVIIVGLFGAVFGPVLMKLVGITHPQAQGVAMGTSAHAIGTAAALNLGEQQGAFSSIALVLCGIFTAILAPLLAWLIMLI